MNFQHLELLPETAEEVEKSHAEDLYRRALMKLLDSFGALSSLYARNVLDKGLKDELTGLHQQSVDLLKKQQQLRSSDARVINRPIHDLNLLLREMERIKANTAENGPLPPYIIPQGLETGIRQLESLLDGYARQIGERISQEEKEIVRKEEADIQEALGEGGKAPEGVPPASAPTASQKKEKSIPGHAKSGLPGAPSVEASALETELVREVDGTLKREGSFWTGEKTAAFFVNPLEVADAFINGRLNEMLDLGKETVVFVSEHNDLPLLQILKAAVGRNKRAAEQAQKDGQPQRVLSCKLQYYCSDSPKPLYNKEMLFVREV